MPGRRAVVRAATGVAVGLAGCSELPGRRPSLPAPPPYAERLHRPAVERYAGETAGAPRFAFHVARPSAVAARTDDLLAAAGDRWTDEGIVRRALGEYDAGVLSPAAVDSWVGTEGSVPTGDGRATLAVGAAIEGAFDPAAVRERVLAADGTAPAGSHRGFNLVRLDEGDQVLAFGAGMVVRVRGDRPRDAAGGEPLTAVAEPALDGLLGEGTPAPAGDQTLGLLVGHLGEGRLVRGRTPPGRAFDGLSGLVAWGAASVAVEGLRQRWVGVFADEPPVDAVERRLRAGYFLRTDGVERRGSAVVATGRVDLPVWLG